MAEISATSFPSSSSSALVIRSSHNGSLSLSIPPFLVSSISFPCFYIITNSSSLNTEFSISPTVFVSDVYFYLRELQMGLQVINIWYNFAGSLKCQNVAVPKTTSQFQEVHPFEIDAHTCCFFDDATKFCICFLLNLQLSLKRSQLVGNAVVTGHVTGSRSCKNQGKVSITLNQSISFNIYSLSPLDEIFP